jgi:pSer/pThr/pTyr-binding forkhead associated (FHA) protein
LDELHKQDQAEGYLSKPSAMASQSMLSQVKTASKQQLISTSAVTRFGLAVLDAAQFGRRDIDLDDGESIVIGRSSKSDHKLQPSSTNCRFDCPVVSRAHAVLLCNEGQLSIRDTGSLHGTFVNHQSITNDKTVVLHDGDVITLGAEVLRAHGKSAYNAMLPWKSSLTNFKENYQAIRLVVNRLSPPAAKRITPTYAYESDLVEDEEIDDDEEDLHASFELSSRDSFEEDNAEAATSKQPSQSKVPATTVVHESVQESYSASEQPMPWYGVTMADTGAVPVVSCDGTSFGIHVDDELDSDDAQEELDLELSDDSESESDSDDEQITTSIVVDTTSNDVTSRTTTTVPEIVDIATKATWTDHFAAQGTLFSEQESAFAERARWAHDQMEKFQSSMVSSLPTPPTTHTHSSGQWYDPVRSAHEESESVVASHARHTYLDEEVIPSAAKPAAAATIVDAPSVQDSIMPMTTASDDKKRKHEAIEESGSADEQPVTKKMAPIRSEQSKSQVRRFRSLPSRTTVRKVASQASQVAVGAVLGMVGTVAFLSSPYAEQLIQWLD